jgi:hypothetical protein
MKDVPSFMTTDSAIQNSLGEDTQTYKRRGDIISLLFIKIRKVEQKKEHMCLYVFNMALVSHTFASDAEGDGSSPWADISCFLGLINCLQ